MKLKEEQTFEHAAMPCKKNQRQQKAETKEQKEEVLDRKIIKTNEDFLFDFFVPFFAFFCTVKNAKPY